MPNLDDIKNFSEQIEELVWDKDISYTDAIILYCQTIGLEVELSVKLISAEIKAKVKKEAEELHFLPKPSPKLRMI